VLVFACIFSCNRSQKESNQSQMSDMVVDTVGVAIDKPVDKNIQEELGERKFIRTADLKFKVNKVEDAVMDIENKTRAFGGFVNLSRLNNRIQDSTNIAISLDSSLQTIHFVTEGFLILRVPDYRMDSLLTILNPLSILTLNREIRADDVRIQMLANQLSIERSVKTSHRIEKDIDVKGKKLSDIEQSEKTREEGEESADNSKISNLTMDDAVKFSTVSIEIYQDPGIRYAEVARERKINEYQAPFLSRIGESFSGGWQLLKDLIILLTKYWTVLIILLLGYMILFKYIRLNKNMKSIRA
jgi:hypothetical protein